MTSLAASISPSLSPLAVAMVLGALAFHWLLPRPTGRSLALGTFAALAAASVLVLWVMNRFGAVASDVVGTLLFCLFSGGAILFATIFVTQRNPARGAIAFAFVIISVCGLFLLLAAPFLMAATIIIYAGAIIVTFLFVLMLSQTRLASDENDRSREPLLGSLGAFAFLGLILFAQFTSSPAVAVETNREYPLPARLMLPTERTALAEAADKLKMASLGADRDAILTALNGVSERINLAVGGRDAVGANPTNIPVRLAFSMDPHAVAIRHQAEKLSATMPKALTNIENKLLTPKTTAVEIDALKAELATMSTDVSLLAAHGELPARNVANMGYVLYSDYLLGVEMAGAVLLVATIGAVLIANRRHVAGVAA
ncbi:hypothetical protein BH11PLA2_BH11PLA2_13140 [soil metagenome]